MAASARYFDLVREMKNPYNHRLRLVESVRERGIKPTARLFAASTLTVRKWWRRYQQLGPPGLQVEFEGYIVTPWRSRRCLPKVANCQKGVCNRGLQVSDLAGFALLLSSVLKRHGFELQTP